MIRPVTDHDRAAWLYAKLVGLYPRPHRDRFGPQMKRTFEDMYRHATAGERRAGIGFWLAVFWDEGRSIVRERAAEPQGDVTFYALILIWVVAALFAPVIPAASDWRNLVFPTGVLGVLLLVVPGRSGIGRRLATIVFVFAVAEFMTAVARAMRIQNDLLAPVLLVACMAFLVKILAGANARIVGAPDRVWRREELLYGVAAGFAGVLGLAPGMLVTSDNNPAFGVVFFFVVPLVCGVAGFKSGVRDSSIRWGTYAALGSLLIGATIWFVALPLLYEGALLAHQPGHSVPALLPVYWQRPLASILFWAALNGMVGAFFGVESTRKDGKVPPSPSRPVTS